MTQATARANTAATIQGSWSGGGAVAATWDDGGSGNFPTVTAILTAPHGSVYNPGATLDGYTYNNWSFLAQDPSGSLDTFYSSTVAGTAGYTPTVGDNVYVTGGYIPYSGIGEMENVTTPALPLTVQGQPGGSFYSASPVLTSIPTINVGTNGNGLSLSGLGGSLLQLNGVTISGTAANWAVHANVTGTITDAGNNSMTMYLWASSYSTCGAIAAAGGPVPTGEVDMTGFISDFYSTLTSSIQPEFVPISITEVPEPAALSLCGLGSLLAWSCYRLRKKA